MEKIYFRAYFLLLFIGLLVIACQPSEEITATQLPPNTSIQPTIAILPSSTEIASSEPKPTQKTQNTLQPTNTPRFTNTPKPTNTLIPIQTSTPTIISFPPFSENSPYLIYLVNLSDDRLGLALLNMDGTGRKVLPLPQGAYIIDIASALSPDGEFIAFHSGSMGNEPYDLTLNIMHLPEGDTKTITHLLSDEFPDNFQEVAKTLMQSRPDSYPTDWYSVDSLSQYIQEVFQLGIYSIAWSPNSRYLAFAGQMEGPSSDIYRYNRDLATITRLTDGLEQILGISWSQDSKWIFHEASNEPVGAGWSQDLFAVQFDGSKAKMLYERTFFWGWISSTTYGIYNSANGPGQYNFRIVDIDTDQTLFFWPDSFYTFVVDIRKNIMAIQGHPLKNEDLEAGIYLIYPNGTRRFVTEGYWSWGLKYRGGLKNSFTAINYGGPTIGISHDGTITQITEKFGHVEISPDYRWMLIYHEELPGIDLFSETDEFVRHITNQIPDRIIWQPDSNAIFYRLGTELYYVSIPDGQPIRIDENLVDYGWEFDPDYHFAWVK